MMAPFATFAGSCRVDSASGNVIASIVSEKMEQGQLTKNWYQCDDPSMLRIIEDMYRLLMHSKKSGFIQGNLVNKTMTSTGKSKVEFDVGPFKFQMLTTRNQGNGYFLISLTSFPFNRTDHVDRDYVNEVVYEEEDY